jgi:hypothetical protein
MFRMMNRKLLVMGLVVAAVLAFNLSTVAAMQIGVQVVSSGETLTLDVEPTDTIQNIRQMILDKTGMAPLDQVLIFEDQVLEDNRTLADYSIQKDSSLLLMTSAEATGAVTTPDATPTSSDIGNPQMGDSIPWLPAVAAVVALAVLVVLGLGRKKK